MIPPEQVPRGKGAASAGSSGTEQDAAARPASETPASASALSSEQWSGLCTYLEQQLDSVRAETARVLHDELGGLLVATKMDLSHLQHSVRGQEPELRERLSRAQISLDAVIATERRVVEDLQPGLLTHIGLFAALRWYVDHLNAQGNAPFEADIAAGEPFIEPSARVALYQAVQAALQICAGSGARLVATEHRGTVSLTVGPLPAVLSPDADVRVLAIRHRIAGTPATMTLNTTGAGASLTIRLAGTR